MTHMKTHTRRQKRYINKEQDTIKTKEEKQGKAN